MNKKKLCIITVICLVAILLFPIPTKQSYSGTGEVYTEGQEERIGECILSVEVMELKSILYCYKRSFSFTLDGTKYDEFESCYHSDLGSWGYSIHQAYYNRIMDSIEFCSLYYNIKHSRLEISLKGNAYILPISTP